MIKRLLIAGFLFLSLGLARGQAQTNESFVLVGLTGYDGAKTFDVVAPDAFTTLVHEAKLDNEALPKAYSNMLKSWREAHAKNEKKDKNEKPATHVPFPFKCPAPREVRQLGVYPTADEANKEKQTLQDQEAARLKRLAAEEERLKPPAPAETGLKHPARHASGNTAKAPDATLITQTMAALISEIATVRADIAAAANAKTDDNGSAPAPAPGPTPAAPKATPKAHK